MFGEGEIINRIHYPPGDGEAREEAMGFSQIDGKEKFLRAIIGEIINCLDVNYIDRRIVEGLIRTSLKNVCYQLLTDFLHIELEILSESVAKGLGVEKQVDYNYATYAKFSTMLDQQTENKGK